MPGLITSAINTLQQIGVPSANIPSALQSIFSMGPNAAIQQICQTLLANSGNAEVVKDASLKLAEIPNLPASVAAFIPQLQALAAMASPTNPINSLSVVMLTQGIETAMQNSNPLSIL